MSMCNYRYHISPVGDYYYILSFYYIFVLLYLLNNFTYSDLV